MYTVDSYIWLCLGKKKGLNPLDSSLYLLKLGIFCHVLLGVWWRWRQLNKLNKYMFYIDKKLYKNHSVHRSVQIICCWAVFLVMVGGSGMVILTTGGGGIAACCVFSLPSFN